MPKIFKCSACKGQHKRPTIVNCPFVNSHETSVNNLNAMNSDDNAILHALEAVSSRLSAIEQRIECTEERLDASAQVGLVQSPGQASTSTKTNSGEPTMNPRHSGALCSSPQRFTVHSTAGGRGTSTAFTN